MGSKAKVTSDSTLPEIKEALELGDLPETYWLLFWKHIKSLRKKWDKMTLKDFELEMKGLVNYIQQSEPLRTKLPDPEDKLYPRFVDPLAALYKKASKKVPSGHIYDLAHQSTDADLAE
ncbi:MAG: hypothetical protein M1823_003411 [Watsoniomyces obsoletus]|nr:MAG: hypothetical protein M1823_003411 [Watsoniomyces obsoletus]